MLRRWRVGWSSGWRSSCRWKAGRWKRFPFVEFMPVEMNHARIA